MFSQCQRARVRRMTGNVLSGRVALERQQRFDFRVLRERFRARRIDRAPVAIETEDALLRALQRSAHVEHVLHDEFRDVDERPAAILR